MESDVQERLAGIRVDMPSDVAARHLTEIRAELASPGVPTVRHRPVRLRRLALIVTALVLLLLPAAAMAEDAVPGDVLFPVKQITEQIRSLFDRDVQARHRVEEVEILIDRQVGTARVEERIRIAEDVVTDTDSELFRRLDRAREEQLRRVGESGDRGEVRDVRPSGDIGDRATSTTVTDQVGEQRGHGADATTTTIDRGSTDAGSGDMEGRATVVDPVDDPVGNRGADAPGSGDRPGERDSGG